MIKLGKSPALAGLSLVLCCLTGCFSTIERAPEIANHKLAAKVSTKADIVNSIGLPRTIERNTERGLEIWLYTGKPINTSYFVPVPIAAVPAGGGMSTVYYLDAGSKNITRDEKVILALIFNSEGLLVEIQNK